MGSEPPRRTGQALKLKEALAKPTLDLEQLSSRLDSVDQGERLAEIWSLNAVEQARLFEAVKGHHPITVDDLVPAGTAALQGVTHEGKNSLPMFNHFAKVFYRPEASAAELNGFNRNDAVVGTTVGPGYFVAYAHGPGEVLLDYTRLPTKKPDGWPAIAPNDSRLSRFVYNNTKDLLRGVSKHVIIGHASRNGVDLPNWFVLCRVGS